MQLYEFLERLLTITEASPVISRAMDADGDVDGIELEWYKGPRKIVSIVIGRDDSIAWGLILDDVSASGEFIMDEWKDARPAVAALKKWEAA